jgi:carboxypeptidase C (cathepsin A)
MVIFSNFIDVYADVGGPGCSSLDGFFYEHGPFEVDRSDFTKLEEREFRWNTIVNMLYIEAPVGVGFSYSTSGDYKCDDDRTANENRAAVEDFYSKFPEYKNNQLWITGESYAGVYVPTLAEAILHGEKDGSYSGAKLTGIAVGNGCSGTEVGICGDGPQGTYYEWQYLLNTAFIDQALKDSVNEACDWDSASKNVKNALSAKCVSLLNAASTEIGHVNMYNIYGDW